MRDCLICTFIGGALLSVDAQAVDLLQAVKKALSNDARYDGTRATLAAGQEKSIQGRASLLPTVGLSGNDLRSGLYASQPDSPAEIVRHYTTSNDVLSLPQPLSRWANWALYQQVKLRIALSETQFARARPSLIVRVWRAYFGVLGHQVGARINIGVLNAQQQLYSTGQNLG